jgi:CBS-domain-containing membrane protein
LKLFKLPHIRKAIAGNGPAHSGHGETTHTAATVAAALLILGTVGAMVHEPLLFPPLAASAAVIHAAPSQPFSQPRSVIGGHLIAALTGLATVNLLGSSTWAAAVASALTYALMTLARKPHPPAVATAALVVLQQPKALEFVGMTLLGSTVLVLAGVAAGRALPKAPRYPAYWW